MKAEGREVAGARRPAHHRHRAARERAASTTSSAAAPAARATPAQSRFFLSLEDDLMRMFAGEWVSAVLTRLGMEEGEAIESSMVSRRIEGAQKKVEERNFDIRKNLLEYDEVMDEQRKRVYSLPPAAARRRPRQGRHPGDDRRARSRDAVDRFLADDYGAVELRRVGRPAARASSSTAKDFKGPTFEDAEEHAKRPGRGQLADLIREAIEENLPSDAEPAEWTWQALATGPTPATA